MMSSVNSNTLLKPWMCGVGGLASLVVLVSVLKLFYMSLDCTNTLTFREVLMGPVSLSQPIYAWQKNTIMTGSHMMSAEKKGGVQSSDHTSPLVI